MSSAVDKVLMSEQAGFRGGRSSTDQIFSFRNSIVQCSELHWKLYINFIDFQKTLDNIRRGSLWNILRISGISTHVVNIIKQFYSNFSCTVGTNNMSFAVKSGVC